MYYLLVWFLQVKSRSGSAGGPGSVPPQVSLKPDCSHLKAQLGLKGPLPRWLPHMAIGRRPQLCTREPLDMAAERPRDGAAGFPQLPSASPRSKQGKS